MHLRMATADAPHIRLRSIPRRLRRSSPGSVYIIETITFEVVPADCWAPGCCRGQATHGLAGGVFYGRSDGQLYGRGVAPSARPACAYLAHGAGDDVRLARAGLCVRAVDDAFGSQPC